MDDWSVLIVVFKVCTFSIELHPIVSAEFIGTRRRIAQCKFSMTDGEVTAMN